MLWKAMATVETQPRTTISLRTGTRDQFLEAAKVYGISADRMMKALLKAWEQTPASRRHAHTLASSS
jgi:hypothetical protein